MAPWKVLLIGLLSCVSFALALSTVLVTISHEGGQRWLWMVSLLAATAFASTLLVVFMRHASASLDARPRGSRN